MSLLSRTAHAASVLLTSLGAACAHIAEAEDGGPKLDSRDPAQAKRLIQTWSDLHDRWTARPQTLLNPDGDARIEIEAYVFSLNPSQFAYGSHLVWGTANGWTAHKNPQITFLAEQMFVNVSTEGLVYLNTIQGGCVQVELGGIADAFTFSPVGAAASGRSGNPPYGLGLGLPALHPANTMQVTGPWSTLVPSKFTEGQVFTLAIDFLGWGSMRPDDGTILRKVSGKDTSEIMPQPPVDRPPPPWKQK